MTQIELAKNKRYSPEMKFISKREGLDLETIRKGISQGKIVIPHNKKRRPTITCGIGKGLTTKVNANLGTSSSRPRV